MGPLLPATDVMLLASAPTDEILLAAGFATVAASLAPINKATVNES